MSRIALHDTGRGAAVLFLHAFPLDSSQWDHQVAALSGATRCLRPDFWGCGTSPPGPTEPSLGDFVDEVITELGRRGIGDVAVVGNSMGGYTAFALWRAAPQRVRSVALLNTRAGADDGSARAARATMCERVRAGGVETIVEQMTDRLLCPACRRQRHIADPVRGRIRRCTSAGIVGALSAIAGRPDSSALLAGISVPVLVVGGSADAVVPIEETRGLAAAIPGARWHGLDHGHLSNLEQPAEVSALLAGFLDVPLPARREGSGPRPQAPAATASGAGADDIRQKPS